MSVDRDGLRHLADEATPGPWKVYHRCSGCTEMDDETCGLGLELDPGPEEPQLRGTFSRSADARFIAAAREAVPDLLDLLDLLDRCETALAAVLDGDLSDHWVECPLPPDANCQPCHEYARSLVVARAVLADLRASAAVAGSGR